MTAFTQRSMARGEIAPSMYGRVDLAQYGTGLRTCRNFLIMRQGGAKNRSGSEFVNEHKDADKVTKLMAFDSGTDSFVLTFGDLYMRVTKDGEQVNLASEAITGASKTNPSVLTITGHSLVINDEIHVDDVLGMVQFNKRNFIVSNTTINTVTLSYLNGASVNATGYDTYVSGGTAAKVFELTTPYVEADLQLLKDDQSVDLVTITHQIYPIKELRRITDTNWTLTDKSFSPETVFPENAAGTAGAGGPQEAIYKVTAIDPDNFEESLPALQTTFNITGISQTDPIVVTAPGHDYVEGNIVELRDLTDGAEELNERRFTVGVVSGTTVDGDVDNITGITLGNPTVILAPGNARVVNDLVRVDSVVGTVELNGNEYTVIGSSGDNLTLDVDSTSFTAYISDGTITNRVGPFQDFELKDEDGTSGLTPYVSGGKVGREEIVVASASEPTTSDPNDITWDEVDGVIDYTIYRSVNGVFGFLGVASGTSFEDVGVDPDTTDTPPSFRTPFFGAGNFPATSAYHQQRQLFANTINKPEFVEGSRTGRFDNFTRSSPLKDDDAVRWQLSGKKINAVQNLLDINGKLMTLTQSGEWRISGDGSGVLTPTEINPVRESGNGSSFLKPVVVNSSALYIQARQSTIRDLGFSFNVDGYTGDDLTVNASHLFDNFTLEAWDHQQIPHSIVWMARSDGQLIGLTYIPEQGMLAYHRHDFENGLVEDVVVVPEGTEDAVYMTIKREIDILGTGTTETVRYLERMVTQKFVEIEDQIFMDSTLTVDGRNTSSTTMKLTPVEAPPTWDYTEDLTLTASTATFLATDVAAGREIELNGFKTIIDDKGRNVVVPDVIRCKIRAFTSTKIVTVRPSHTVDLLMREVFITDWSSHVKTVNGLWHLEGQEVSVFADAFVVASPNNNKYDPITVENGAITLDRNYGLIHVGLPITSDLETLSIDTANGKTLQSDFKLISNVTMLVEASRGVWVGNGAPPNDTVDPLENLNEEKPESLEEFEFAVPPVTGTIEVNIESDWNGEGLVFIRQVDPIPVAILNITPRGAIPFG